MHYVTSFELDFVIFITFLFIAFLISGTRFFFVVSHNAYYAT